MFERGGAVMTALVSKWAIWPGAATLLTVGEVT